MLTNGDVLNAGSVNTYRFVMVGSEVTAHSTTGTSSINIGSVIVPGNTVQDHVFIMAELRGKSYFADSSGSGDKKGGTGKYKITVDGTEVKGGNLFDFQHEQPANTAADHTYEARFNSTHLFVPSSAQLSNGFSIAVMGSVVDVADATNTIECSQLYVMGG